MFKFKVGDNVRVIRPVGALYEGRICTVDGTFRQHMNEYINLKNGLYGGWLVDRFELVQHEPEDDLYV
jgi:hypothetical protein